MSELSTTARTNRRGFLTAGLAGTIPAIAGCLGTSSGGNDGGGIEEMSDVSMTESQFQPRNIRIDSGTAVTWTNEDSFEHTVTSASENWDVNESVSGGGSVEHTFEDDGVYDVYCTLHGVLTSLA